jgi:hypothetical protein
MYLDSRGETVIDYGMVNEEAWKRVEEVRIGERAESDHLEIVLRKRKEGKNRERKRWGIEIKLFFFYCCVMCKENVIKNRRIKHSTDNSIAKFILQF